MDENEYRQKLESESYKQLMQGELQAESAKNVALRNTNMALNNAGLQGSAYGGTLANATSNAYLTALQSNFSDFNTNLTNEGERNYNNIIEGLSAYSDTQENYLGALNNLGIADKGDGTLDFSGYNGYLTNDQKNNLQFAYKQQMSDFGKVVNGNIVASESSNDDINEQYKNGNGVSFKNDKNTEYSIKLVNNGKTGINKDVDIEIGGYKVQGEMGAKVSTYVGKNAFSKDINDYPKDAKKGQITWQETKDGKGGAFIIYDGTNWRVLEMREGSTKDKANMFVSLCKNYGVDPRKYSRLGCISEVGLFTTDNKIVSNFVKGLNVIKSNYDKGLEVVKEKR